MIEFDLDMQKDSQLPVNIKILGIGGAGCNTINSMIDAGLEEVNFIVANTDAQALRNAKAPCKIQLGVKATKGLGSGANPELGRRATEEDLEKVLEGVQGADIVFLVAGMGGGTGSGGLPVVAKALKDRGVLTIAVVTKPFNFEGKRRMMVAEEALACLKQEVDTLIVVPNEKLLSLVDRSVPMIDAFNMVNELLLHSVRSISSIISRSGHINVDFADLRTIMKGMGLAMMGTGSASGTNRAREAAKKAISSPLLENMDIKGARGVLLNISGGASLSLHEINDAANVIYDESDKGAHIIVGTVVDENLGDDVVVSVVATGFKASSVVPEYKNDTLHKDSDLLQVEYIEQKEKAAYLQKVTEEKPVLAQKSEEKKQTKAVQVYDKDEIDVPAFLRNESGKADLEKE